MENKLICRCAQKRDSLYLDGSSDFVYYIHAWPNFGVELERKKKNG